MDCALITDVAGVKPGSRAYRRISLGMFLAGFATFSLLYCVQPLLALLARTFQVTPLESSLALSLTTGFLAVAILCAGPLSEVVGRRGLMLTSMCAAALLNMASALMPTWPLLLTARALEGLALGGVPAVAMAYLAEEIHPRGLGLSMGLYIGGTAFGGMSGRVGIGVLTELTSWRSALTILGALALIAALAFPWLLPPSRSFRQRSGLDPAYNLSLWHDHLRHPGLRGLFLTGGLLMGAFVTVYNYTSFRLTGAPYSLSPTQLSLIFGVYLLGMAASPVAGALADRLGRAPILAAGIAIAVAGIAVTLLNGLAAIITGIAILTVGFFIAHAVASAWVGALAAHAKAHAASLYLLLYYLGSSILGSAGGWVWARGGWAAVAAFAIFLLVLASITALCGHRSSPLQSRRS